MLPLFLQRINEMCEGANLALSDVKSVRSELAEGGPEVDVRRPCFEILQRAGTTKLEVLLKDDGAARLASVMPEPPEPLPEALRSRFNQLTGPIPVFCLDGFRVAAPGLAATFVVG